MQHRAFPRHHVRGVSLKLFHSLVIFVGERLSMKTVSRNAQWLYCSA
ncbi:hypothetical protein BN931_8 [Bifidobacterium animalis subsp. lactis CECT 8145]|nr:hypothetical protein W91_1594 [Bifidobacterium animalis subsp. lactis Bi-07]AJD34664.1 hypothetical protein BAA6_1551 [Bifidobacterium animalis]QIR81591.1 hypothetical protein M8PIadj_1579 [Bifidobacterium animalis]CDL70832.1 hypothetical protein BN931_8 [Bifidobacterium animalis subsp. lactis CECT 8145]